MTLPPPVKAVFVRVDALSLRERAMVAAAVLAVVWAVWDNFLMVPLNALQAARQDQLASLSTQVADLNRSIQVATTGRTDTGDTQQRNELAALRNEVADLQRRFGERTANLIPPNEMAEVLEALLVGSAELEFVGVVTLPPEPVTGEDGGTGFFRHGLTLRVRGNYLDALSYVEAIEELHWSLFWDSVEIEVDEHPTSDVRITVYTLGEGSAVIGV